MDFSSPFSWICFTCLAFADIGLGIQDCIPQDDVNLSRYGGYGRFEDIVSNPDLDTSSAAIICSIVGRKDFLRVEWILLGDPPSRITFEADDGTLSKLHDSTFVCTASDIPHMNRPGPVSTEKAFVFGTRNVTYHCQGSENLKILFADIAMLSRDFSKLPEGAGSTGSVAKCVRKAELPAGKISDQTGNACSEYSRYMYNETGHFVCAKCCSNHYWLKLDKQCKRCGRGATNLHPNVWTKCKTIIVDEHTAATQTSTVSTTSVSARTPSEAPSSAPEKVTITVASVPSESSRNTMDTSKVQDKPISWWGVIGISILWIVIDAIIMLIIGHCCT